VRSIGLSVFRGSNLDRPTRRSRTILLRVSATCVVISEFACRLNPENLLVREVGPNTSTTIRSGSRRDSIADLPGVSPSPIQVHLSSTAHR
jgi:hypothetical protein